jgi:hypothetical protein
MFGKDSFKTLLAAGALALMAGGASAATVTYQTDETDPKVQLVIDDAAVSGKFRFTLTAIAGFADFLGLGFDLDGATLTVGMIDYFDHTPDSSDKPELVLYGDGTKKVGSCGNGCNFNGDGSGSSLFDHIIGIGEQGAGKKLISSVVFDIKLAGSLDDNPFSNFAVRAQTTSNEEGSIKYGLVEVPPEPVPLPAAGFLLIGALCGLAAIRRRRRAA